MDVREKLLDLLKGSKLCSKRFDDQYSDLTISIIADHLIAHGVTVQEWIPVDERLPDDNDRVIAFRPNEAETGAYKYCVMWGWSVKVSLKQHRGITHWMPLPELPREETT